MLKPRWKATVHYRMNTGPIDVTHDLDEIQDLHDLIEDGPHWDTIIRIEIERVNHCTDLGMTVEVAAST